MKYKVYIDNFSRGDWEQYAKEFADYSIYQTWPYQQVRAEMDGQLLSRFIIKDENDHVVTMGQVRIKYFKPLCLKIGYVQWGPLVCGLDGCLKCTGEVLNILRGTYVGTKVNILRIVPNVPDNEMGREFTKLLKVSGFCHVPRFKPYHTMALSLDCSEEQLRKRLHQSWRRQLSKAERANIEVVECNSHESFEMLERLYLATIQRKGIRGLDPQVFTKTQQLLSSAEKMSLILAYNDGQSVTVHLTSNLGDSAIFLLGGSSKEGLECRASYLAWWNAIMHSSEKGMRSYDVGGIDFEENPTVSRFKAGMGGQEVSNMGAFDACSSVPTKVIWHISEKVYSLVKR